MPSAAGWEVLAPSSSHHERRRSFSALENGQSTGVGICNAGVSRRTSFSYYRLPEQLIRLTIVKLDGSSFDVQVLRSASVSELKLAVEEVFSQSPKEGKGKISWSHVWGHFCLCYDGQKLIDDKAYLRSFGTKDGDQLHFIRHLSINYNPIERRPRNHASVCEQNRISLSGPDLLEERVENGKDRDHEKADNESCEDCSSDDDFDDDLGGHTEFKLAHFLRGWLSYSRLWCSGRVRSEGQVRPSRFGVPQMRAGSKLMRF